MNLLDLNQDVREQFVLELPDIADVIELERTNRELKEWIKDADIYRRWERKHLGKTDKWRILLTQELAVKNKRSMFLKHVKFNISIHLTFANGEGKIVIVRRQINQHPSQPFLDIARKVKHYFYQDLKMNHNSNDIQQFYIHYDDNHVTSIANYYFLYDLLTYGFEYSSNIDMSGYYTDNERLIRCQLGQPISHKCNLCEAQFCSDADCLDWIEHQEKGCNSQSEL